MTKKVAIKVDRRTIGSETKKIFMVVFAILMAVGTFTVLATWKGKTVFKEIESNQLPLFRDANILHQTMLDIVGIFYLLSGANDVELQMNQMWRYEGLAKNFSETLKAIGESASRLDNQIAGSEIRKSSTEISTQFEEINEIAREMMLANMNGELQAGKERFGILVTKIDTFRKAVETLESAINADLKAGTSSALTLLSGSSLFGIMMTFASIFIAMALIRYLMQFLSVSLLPISNLMHNLRQSVFSIDKAGTVISPVSKHSEAVFAGNIIGHSLDSLVLDHLGKKTEAYSSAKTAMTSVFGEDDMQWSLMEDNLPTLVRRTVGSEEKALKLSYTPLYNSQQLVQNVMIVAEDVTELERAKLEAAKKQTEVRILQGLIGVDRGDLTSFFNDAISGIKQCNDLVSSIRNDLESRKIVFRTLHTIKGNSRLYNLLAISEVIHSTENAVVEINSRLDAKEPVGSEFYDAYLRGLREAEEVIAAHTKVAKVMFGIDDAMAPSRLRQLVEVMWFLELGASDREKPLFDADKVMRSGLELQHALVQIDARWDRNLEQVRKLGHYFGSQEITEAADRLAVQALSPNADVSAPFSVLQESVFRFVAQSPSSGADEISVDSLFPFLNIWSEFKAKFGTVHLSKSAPNERQEFVQKIYDFYTNTDVSNATQMRNLARMIMLAIANDDDDFLGRMFDRGLRTLGWLCAIDSSFNMNDSQRMKVSEALPTSYRRGNYPAIQECGAGETIIGGFLQAEQVGRSDSREIFAAMAKSVGATSITEQDDVLLGSEGLGARLATFVNAIRGGVATSEAQSSISSFISSVGDKEEAALYMRASSSIPDRIQLLTIASCYGVGTSEKSEAATSRTMEVTTDWFEKVSGMVQALELAPKSNIDSMCEELQELLQSVFDYPMVSLCKKMEPMMRDLTIKLGKNINYVVTGQDVALPRDQAYAFRDALVHMLRNSLDHAIEMPSQRAALGKSEFATIEINCNQTEDGSIEINVIDDGGGIDVAKVKAKAVIISAISAETSATMSDEDACQLIFISRLSTKEEVSSLSGRGVGMDAVKAIVVDGMKGKITVSSSRGGGTKFTLTTKKAKRKQSVGSNLDETSAFLLGAAKDVAECLDILKLSKFDQKVSENIFRTLHTIKGNATLLSFKDVALYAHEAENFVVSLLSESTPVVGVDTKVEVEITKLHAEIVAQLSKRNASVSGAGGELGQFLAVSAMTTAEWLTSIDSIASDANLSDRILRTMHTMKSNATMHNQIPMSEKIHEIETKALAFMQKISSGAKVNKDVFTELHSLIKALHTSLLGNLAGAPLKKISSRKSEDPAVAVLENALNSVDSVCKDLADIVSNAEASGKAFRELHTMKGLAAMNNLGALVDVLHKTEGTLDAICKNLSIAKAVGAEQRDQLLSELKSVRFIVEREIDRKRKRFSDAA